MSPVYYAHPDGALRRVRTGTVAGTWSTFPYGADKAATIAAAGPTGTLTTHTGNLVVTTPGAVHENLDITGWVELRANNITLRNCRIRIGTQLNTETPPRQAGVFAWYNTSGHVLENIEIAPSNPTVDTYGIVGSGFTLRHGKIHDCVDHIQINNAHAPVTVQGGHFYDPRFYTFDPRQVDGSHSDLVQIILGGGHTFTGVVFDTGPVDPNARFNGAASAGFAVLATQNSGSPAANLISGFTVDKCWFIGDGYSFIKVEEKGRGLIAPLTITGNRFEGDTNNPMIHGTNTSINAATITGNTGPDGNPLAPGEVWAQAGI